MRFNKLQKEIVIVRLDIFRKIGLGHYIRMSNLAKADITRDYILLYRTDLNNFPFSLNDSFVKAYEIGSPSTNRVWESLDCNDKLCFDDYMNDWLETKSKLIHIEKEFRTIKLLIVDNFLINLDWYECIRDDSHFSCLSIINIDDFNKSYPQVDISINYTGPSNFIKRDLRGNYLTGGLKYSPFSLDLCRTRNMILNSLNTSYPLRNSIMISFGFFDELNLTYPTLQILLEITNLKFNVLLSEEALSYSSVLSLTPNERINLIPFTKNISEIYLDSFLSFGTYGLMSFEKAFLGISQFNILEHPNQERNKITLEKLGLSSPFYDPYSIKIRDIKTIMSTDFQEGLLKNKAIFGDGILEWVKLVDMIFD